MNTTNWDKALTYIVNLRAFRESVGEERVQEMMSALLNAGGTFAVSQDRLHLSDFSKVAFSVRTADWAVQDEANAQA